MSPATQEQIEAAVFTRSAMEAHHHLASSGLRASPSQCLVVKEEMIRRNIRICSSCTSRLHGSNRCGVCRTCQNNRTCDGCGIPVSSASKGACRSCTNARINADPSKRAMQSEVMKRLYADPVRAQALKEHARSVVRQKMQDPVFRANLAEHGRIHGTPNLAAGRTPEARAKAGKSISAIHLAHIPSDYRALYRDLRATGIPAGEAERMVQDQRAKDIASAPNIIARSIQAMRNKQARERAQAY